MKQSWIHAIILLSVMRTVNVQFAMPVPMFRPAPQPLFMMPPPPMPVPVGLPFPVPVPVIVTTKPTTTTTTTTQAPHEANGGGNRFAVGIPLPFGFAMPFVMPQAPQPRFCADKPRQKQCPPCPPCVCAPSCTPAFYSFCSPCHQKCRCKSSSDTPTPEPMLPPPPVPMLPPPMMPMPAYAPPPAPIFIFPLPPIMPIRRPPRKVDPKTPESKSSEDSGSSASSSETDTDSDSDRGRRKRRSRSKRTFRSLRREAEYSDTNDDLGTDEYGTKLVKPVLSYINRQGDVKFEKTISQDDAAHLMGTDRLKNYEYDQNIQKSREFKSVQNIQRTDKAEEDGMKQVLSYQSKQSNLNFETKISEGDATHLPDIEKPENSENIKQIRRFSDYMEDNINPILPIDRRKLKYGTKISYDGDTYLGERRFEKHGRRHKSEGKDSRTVIFSPDKDKKITNLTLSFNIVK